MFLVGQTEILIPNSRIFQTYHLKNKGYVRIGRLQKNSLVEYPAGGVVK